VVDLLSNREYKQANRRLHSTAAEARLAWRMAESAIIRRGELSDIDDVKACIDQAYMSYIPRIGKRPASMDADFEPLLREVASGCWNATVESSGRWQ